MLKVLSREYNSRADGVLGWPLTTAIRLGPYEILSLLGAGGMGEVYRARETRLERIAQRARVPAAVLASGIATLHKLSEQDGRMIDGTTKRG
jgi:serine/threonine protein kinase